MTRLDSHHGFFAGLLFRQKGGLSAKTKEIRFRVFGLA
jgi:hypothetical protein